MMMDGLCPQLTVQSFSLSMYIKISECVDGRHRQTFGVTWADYDGDGDVDCFMSNYVHYEAQANDGVAFLSYSQWHQFWENSGDGTFAEVEGMQFVGCAGDSAGDTGACYKNEWGLWPHLNGVELLAKGTRTAWSSPQFVDIDNDGDYDLLLCGNWDQRGSNSFSSDTKPELCRSRQLKLSC